MKKLIKTSTIILLFVISTSIMSQSYNKNFSSTVSANSNEPINVSVLISNFNLSVVSLIMGELKKIEQANPGIIQYTFYDGKGKQDIQNTQLKTILTNTNVDLIILDMADASYSKDAINRIKESNIPVIFLGNADIQSVMSYTKSYWMGPSPTDGGILQGSIIVDAWNKNKKVIDKNNDNILQYIMIEGTPTNIYAVARTKLSIGTANENNIATQELALKICNWKQDEAKDAIASLFLKYGNKIEAIISNDDNMAIGAIKGLQEYGYNLVNNPQKIMVIGFDGTVQAKELIEKGIMTGTVLQNLNKFANNIQTIILNLFNNKNLIEGTDCKIDSTGKIITAPYDGVLVNLN
ncbi:galactose ABC transporter substrate-binding protein [Clostridium sp.]|uniref:galactose ABC transporter substrate-binding protein n=1 Tax=Clostridium sp. TaxID=1506 RepID=UPI0026215CFD|nr:galactose ABC transporter substrate-binding protein [Clostridium sp.]